MNEVKVCNTIQYKSNTMQFSCIVQIKFKLVIVLKKLVNSCPTIQYNTIRSASLSVSVSIFSYERIACTQCVLLSVSVAVFHRMNEGIQYSTINMLLRQKATLYGGKSYCFLTITE